MAIFGIVWNAERKDEHLHSSLILSWLTWLTLRMCAQEEFIQSTVRAWGQLIALTSNPAVF